jgi:hypothetical protein
MTWKPTTQNDVLRVIQSGVSVPKDIAQAVGMDVNRINTYLARLDTQKKIRRDGKRWVPYNDGLALLDAWK